MRGPITRTLLELVSALHEVTDNDQAVVAAISLINSGRVRLCGNFVNAKIVLSPSPHIGHSSLRQSLVGRDAAFAH